MNTAARKSAARSSLVCGLSAGNENHSGVHLLLHFFCAAFDTDK